MLEAVANLHFIRPAWLLLGPVIVLLWWFSQRQSDPLRGWRAQMDAELLQALVVNGDTGQNGQAYWWLAGWLLALVAVAGPTWRLEPSPFAEDAAPLMILLKAGDSMDRAMGPSSPLERAKLKIADLADVRNGQPLGLLAYAGSAHLVLPPTRDTATVSQMAGEVSPEVMPVPGDRLDLALHQAGELLMREQSGGTLLVVADSVDSDPESLHEARGDASFPMQFLVLTEEGSPEAQTVEAAARLLDGRVQYLTAGEEDITTLAHTAARTSLAAVGGQSSRWQEAGYWLLPLIAVLMALSFRRETTAAEQGTT